MKKALLVAILLVTTVVGISLVVGRAQNPAPDRDRVVSDDLEERMRFLAQFRDTYKMLYVLDRPDNKQVRTIYGNDQAASLQPNQPYPYGSILVMETRPAKVDADGQVILDENGRYQPQDDPSLARFFVSRKEKGFGEAYEKNRGGEWEYVALRPDGMYQTPPQQSASCARCHLDAGPGKDWQYRASLYLNRASGAVPNSLMQHYSFVPGDITVKPGDTVTWYNDDEVRHRIVRDDPDGFDSGDMLQGRSFSQTFTEPGEIGYHCQIHPAMKGKIVVSRKGK